MNTQDILNIVLIIGILVFVVCVSFATYFLIKALQAVTRLTQSLEDTTLNFKNGLQLKTLVAIPSLIVAILSRIFKRGR